VAFSQKKKFFGGMIFDLKIPPFWRFLGENPHFLDQKSPKNAKRKYNTSSY
jgi:hypothetical protein